MKRTLAACFTTLVCVLCIGCGNDTEMRDRLARLEKKLADYESSSAATNEANEKLLSAAQQAIQTLIEMVNDHGDLITSTSSDLRRTKVTIAEKVPLHESSVLSPAEKGYSIARNEYGVFPITLEDAQPYVDGHKVKLSIGNLSSAEMTGGELEIIYGPRPPAFPSLAADASVEDTNKTYDKYAADLEETRKRRRTVKQSVGRGIAANSWTTVEVILSPSKPEELGRVEVQLTFSGLRLGRNP